MKDDLKDLISEKLTGDETFTDHWELYEALDYNGSVHELIDSNIDIYYYSLRQWAVDNRGLHRLPQANSVGPVYAAIRGSA
jgi:hypothetical protein